MEIVFFETSVLVAGSVRELSIEEQELKVEHKFYDQSKGLINFIKKGKIQGISTATVEMEAENSLEKAIRDEISLSKEEIRTKEKFETFSIIYDSVQRQFKENIKSMDRLRTEETIVGKILAMEVNPMYCKIERDEMIPSMKTWTGDRKYIPLAKEIRKLKLKRLQKKVEKTSRKPIYADPIDRLILSEAIYLKRHRFEDEKIFLASLDNHFSGMSPPYDQIPIEIERKFGIICKTPNDLFKYLD